MSGPPTCEAPRHRTSLNGRPGSRSTVCCRQADAIGAYAHRHGALAEPNAGFARDSPIRIRTASVPHPDRFLGQGCVTSR
ncbi:hypothetical protein Sm713_36350 [Streptomyces sp. TS71-3]|nr:hypothetical protein Sm713_36350 [Streptomyces sp. TS71-3]